MLDLNTRVLPARRDDQISQTIREAADLLRAGELVAFPTDTVYGVGASLWQPAAVAKLYAAKLRPKDKAIPVLLAGPEDLVQVALAPSGAVMRVAAHFWPGALTLVVNCSADVPDEVTAGGATVAVRVPDHPIARALIRACGSPLATTSANISGFASPDVAEDVVAQLSGRIALIVDGGRCPGGTASTIVDVSGEHPVLLRPGPITLEQVEAVYSATRAQRIV